MATTNGNLITFSATDTNYTLTAPGAFRIFGNNLGNNIIGNDDANLISGADGSDNLLGNGGNDSLYGGDGADTLNGGTGVDSMQGGYGNDAYYIDSAGDVVQENANEGTDIVYTSTVNNYTLSSHVENLTLQGSADLHASGNDLNNRMAGNIGDNLLSGLGGNDQLYGGLGNDTLYGGDGDDLLNGNENQNELHGGAGNDFYFITVGLDSIFENANEGIDTVETQASYTLGANFENLQVKGSSNATLRGNAANNVMVGNSGDNQLFGEAGNDTLYGKGGMNTLVGGTGDDIYHVSTTADIVDEKVGEGNDTVILDIDPAYGSSVSLDYTLSDGLDNLLMSGRGTGNNLLTGNNLSNKITANSAQSIYSLGGNDTITASYTGYIDAGDGNDVITLITGSGSYLAGAGNDTIDNRGATGSYMRAEAGNDTLMMSGEANSCHLHGGAGDDTYVFTNLTVNYYNYIFEYANGGTDTIKTDISFSLERGDSTLSACVDNNDLEAYFFENLLLVGTGNIDGYGNALNNSVYGNSGNNVLEGHGGNDYVVGFGGSDTLSGGDGNDVVALFLNKPNGVTFNPTGTTEMTGGAGSDSFWMARGLVGNHATGANQVSITDFVHGQDKIMLSVTSDATKPTGLNMITASAGATLSSLLDQAAAANAAIATPTLTAFTFSGNTYLVLDQSAGNTFDANADWAVKIVGEPTLTFSDFSYRVQA